MGSALSHPDAGELEAQLDATTPTLDSIYAPEDVDLPLVRQAFQLLEYDPDQPVQAIVDDVLVLGYKRFMEALPPSMGLRSRAALGRLLTNLGLTGTELQNDNRQSDSHCLTRQALKTAGAIDPVLEEKERLKLRFLTSPPQKKNLREKCHPGQQTKSTLGTSYFQRYLAMYFLYGYVHSIYL